MAGFLYVYHLKLSLFLLTNHNHPATDHISCQAIITGGLPIIYSTHRSKPPRYRSYIPSTNHILHPTLLDWGNWGTPPVLPSESNIETKSELTTEPETAAPIEQKKNPAKFTNGWISLCLTPKTIPISSHQSANQTTPTNQ